MFIKSFNSIIYIYINISSPNVLKFINSVIFDIKIILKIIYRTLRYVFFKKKKNLIFLISTMLPMDAKIFKSLLRHVC